MAKFHTTVVRPPNAPKKHFSLLSLNVLCKNEYPHDYLVRQKLNIDHILTMAPTVAVLVEVQDMQGYTSLLEQGGYDKSVNIVRNSPNRDGILILWKSKEATMLDHSNIHFSIDDNEVALVCLMDIKGFKFILIGWHGRSGRTHEEEKVRIRHSKAIFEFVEEKKHSWGDLPIIWTGDHNAGPHNYNGNYPAEWYPCVVTGDKPVKMKFNPDDPDAKEQTWANAKGFHPYFPLSSALREARHGTSEPSFTTLKWRGGKLISQTKDYILFTKGALQVVGWLPTPDKAVLEPEYLPKPGLWGSDHLSVYCEFALPQNQLQAKL